MSSSGAAVTSWPPIIAARWTLSPALALWFKVSTSIHERSIIKEQKVAKTERRTTMMKICSILYAVVIFSLITGFFTAQGSALMIEMSIEELTYEADAILTGRVKDMESRWNEEKTLIYTYVTVSVTEYIEMIPEIEELKEVIVKVRGGEVGDIGVKVSDTPEFMRGEEVFLFLRRDRIEKLPIFRVAGLFQGKYTIEEGKVKNKLLEWEIPLNIFIGQIEEIMKKAEGRQ